jgi:hypothetical protein
MIIHLSIQRIANFSQKAFGIHLMEREKEEEKHASLEILSANNKWRLSTTLVVFEFHHNQ